MPTTPFVYKDERNGFTVVHRTDGEVGFVCRAPGFAHGRWLAFDRGGVIVAKDRSVPLRTRYEAAEELLAHHRRTQ